MRVTERVLRAQKELRAQKSRNRNHSKKAAPDKQKRSKKPGGPAEADGVYLEAVCMGRDRGS